MHHVCRERKCAGLIKMMLGQKPPTMLPIIGTALLIDGISKAGLFFYMMLGSKDPSYDTCGLFRASRSHNPAKYSDSMGPLPHYVLIFWRVPRSIIHHCASTGG